MLIEKMAANKDTLRQSDMYIEKGDSSESVKYWTEWKFEKVASAAVWCWSIPAHSYSLKSVRAPVRAINKAGIPGTHQSISISCSFRLDGLVLSISSSRMAEFDFCLELDFIFNYTNFYQYPNSGPEINEKKKFCQCCDWAEVKWRT